MGQSVLSNQLIAGLLPELKRKIAYIEGATFSELWQKARFEEAQLLDLARTGTRPAAMPWKQRFPRDDAPQQEQWKQQPPQGNLQRQERSSLSLAGGRTGDGQRRNPQFVKCYNCNRTGHFARDCRSVRPVGEAPARTQNPKASNWNAATRAAAVVSVPGECQSRGEEEPLKWMYEMYGLLHTDAPPADSCLRLGPTLTLPLELDGIPVQALVDTGCPATIISREICRKILDKEREEAEPLTSEQWKEKAAKRLRQPGLLLKAYCGTELNIGAEIAVHVATPHLAVNRVVQKDTPVHMLLGTDLMSALGIRVLDSNGQSLLVPLMEQPQPVGAVKQPQPVGAVEQPQPVRAVEQPQPVQVVEQRQPVRVVTGALQPAVDGTLCGMKSLSPCLKIGNRRYSVHGYSEDGQGPGSTQSSPATGSEAKSPGTKRIPVHLIRACKLPGRCGKLLKAKLKRNTSVSSFE